MVEKYKIFDTHTHYDDKKFNGIRNEVLRECFQNGIIGILNCSSSLESLRCTYKLSNEYNRMYGALGLHPFYAHEFNQLVKKEIIEKSENQKIIAIGEIGLDYKDGNIDKKLQKKIFIEQMEIAKKLKFPVIIHSRNAHQDTMDIVKSFQDVKGVMHCFSGSLEMAKIYIKLGYFIGVGGVITWDNSQKINKVVNNISMENILIETDAPYISPEPYRGEINKSIFLVKIIEKIANIKSEKPCKISDITIMNTKKLLNLI